MEGVTVAMDTTEEPHKQIVNGFQDNTESAESADLGPCDGSQSCPSPSPTGVVDGNDAGTPDDAVANGAASAVVNGNSTAVINNSILSDGSKIEPACLLPMSPVSNKIVDSIRKEPRAKMTMSPNKSSLMAVSTNNIMLKTPSARKTMNTASTLEKSNAVKEPVKETSETESPSSPSTAGREGDIPKETASVETEASQLATAAIAPPSDKDLNVISSKPTNVCEKQSEKNSQLNENAKGDKVIETSKTKTALEAAPKQTAVSKDLCDTDPKLEEVSKSVPPQVKSGTHRARKSCQSSKVSNSRGESRTNSNKTNPLALANMTLRLDEIEKTLGIETLSNIDAKTLDKLILEKARTPKKPEGSVPVAKSTPSPLTKPVLSSGAAYSPGNIRMVSILKKDHVLSIKHQDSTDEPEAASVAEVKIPGEPVASSSAVPKYSAQLAKKKKRKKRPGVYNLPGTKKKKKATGRRPVKLSTVSANHDSLDESYETVSEISSLDSTSCKSVDVAALPVPCVRPLVTRGSKYPELIKSPSSPPTPVLQMPPSLNKAKFTVLISPKEQPQTVKLKRTPILVNPVKVAKLSSAARKSALCKRALSLCQTSPVIEPPSPPKPVASTSSGLAPSLPKPKERKKKIPPGGYVRGPYKPRKPKIPPTPQEIETSCKTIVKADPDASRVKQVQPEKRASGDSSSGSGSGVTGRQSANLLYLDSTSDMGTDSDSSKNLKKKKRRWAGGLAYDPKGKAKRKKMKLARANAIKHVLPALIKKTDEQTGLTCIKGRTQRSVMDMFRELREKGALRAAVPLPSGSRSQAESLAQEVTVSTATQVETSEPPLLDLPLLRKEDISGESLLQIKATLNAEATQQSARRSKRKRKPRDDDWQSVTGSSTAASHDESEAEPSSAYNPAHAYNCPCGDHEEGPPKLRLDNVKRRKLSSDRQDVSDETPDLLPIVSLPDIDRRHSDHTPSPPIISPQKPLQVQPDSQQHSDTASTSSGSSSQLSKFVNTPNGVTYPVTPPKTPESHGNNGSLPISERGSSQFMSPLAKERDYLPLCCCRIIGASFSHNHQVLYCQALDSIDGRVVGCCNKVTNSQLVRPAVKIPFMAICEVHRKRLKLHQCCPGCGHFCTQGKFYQCKKEGGTAIHHFHRQCQVFKDNKYYCPHCGEESSQYEVMLKLHEPRASFFIKDPSKTPSDLPPRAKMGTASRPAAAMGGKKSEDKDEGVSLLLEGSGKEISTVGMPLGPSRVDLENAIAMLNGEKPKKLRTGPKSLFHAVSQQDLERLLFLLAEGTDPNFKYEEHDNQSVMHSVALTGNVCIAHLLIQAGASPHAVDDQLRTPLMVAAEEGHVELANYLIKAGAVVDVKAEDGMTSLHLAAQAGCVSMCKFLLQNKGVDINVKDDGGWTPLIWAAEHRYLNTVKFLLAAGADPNIRDNEENTALHWAAYAGSVDIAELFLNAGCDIETPNEHGDRALHIAARQDHYQCVVLFLARGADTEARNNENEAPIGCCVDQEGQVWMALRVNRQLKDFAVKRFQQPEKLLHRDISMGRESNPIPVVNQIDDENYPQDFHYVTENVETSPMMVNRVITSLQSCKCKDDCSSMFCVCSRNSVQCWYDKEGRLVKDFNQIEPPLIFECNKACKCWATCQNRVVQLGITCRLQVFRTKGRGWGVRTLLDIPQGTFICEYIGEHISDAEADAREDDSYLFDLDNKDTDTFCIDARRYANVARFVNHLCEPNLIPVKVFIEHQDLRFPRICFFSSRDIKAGEELGFDYGEKFWIIKWKQFTCACSSPKCKYSSETIHQTIADYNRRQQEEEAIDHDQP